MKRILSVLLVLSILVMPVAAFAEDVTLNFFYWDEAFKPVIDEVNNTFMEKNPGIKIESSTMPFGQYWTKLQTTLTSDSGADIFWLNYMYSLDFLPKGLVHKIDASKIETDKYAPALTNMFSYDGDLYAVPMMYDTIALYYNKSLFDAAGVAYPTNDWTWADLREAAKALTVRDAAGNVTQFGYIADMSSQSGIFNFFLQNGVTGYEADGLTPNFNCEAGKEAFQFIYDMMFVDQSIPTAAQLNEMNKDDRFMAYQAAMVYAMPPRAMTYADALGVENLGCVQMPAGKMEGTSLNSVGFAGSASSKYPEAVESYLEFVASEEAQKILSTSTLTAYQGSESAWLENYPNVGVENFISAIEYATPLLLSAKRPAETRKILETETAAIFMQEKSIDQALSDIESQIVALLSEAE